MFVSLAVSLFVLASGTLREGLLTTLPGCSYDALLPVTPVDTVSVTSRSLCAAKCVADSSCRSVNVCSVSAGVAGYACQLLSAGSNQSCISLQPQLGCQFLSKDERCQNGGTYISANCTCPREFTGSTCGRYYRDCTEAFDSGVITAMTDIHIQPETYPIPIFVTCFATFAGWTKIQRRFSNCPDSFNRTWDEYKNGWRDGCGFWIGLDAIHALTTQGNYELLIWTTYATAQYRNFYYEGFSVSSESTGYAMTYTAPRSGLYVPSGDGFGYGNPDKRINGRKFATWDRPDKRGCALIDGGGWWYGKECPDTNLNRNMPTDHVAKWLDDTGDLEDLIYESMSVRRV